MTNLIELPEYDAIEAELRAELKKLREQYQYKAGRDWRLRTVLEH